MTISQQYAAYLHHFGSTVTLSEFVSEAAPSAIALRHDVDHDIDIALEMARYEHDRGIKATYFVLHSAPYWNDPRLIDKLLQLQDYNHEVGIHVNVLTEWMRGETDDPAQRLREVMSPLRKAGVRLSGLSAHGDKLCYEAGFINYWAFVELRPDDPMQDEDKRTAEGPLAHGRDRRVRYPLGNELRRADGKRFPLWSISMRDLGIDYDAWHVKSDGYFSDSGGSWSRTPDPIEADLTQGRHQVLVHPIHWLGSPRSYFFLSPARSGSKWLAHFLDVATPVEARHEFMLNHDFYEKRSPEKATGSGFAQLADDKEAGTRLIAEGWSRREEVTTDYAEVNVYLEAFLDTLKDFYPDATFVALQRDPRAVVRSLVSRGWYDTPNDDRHRRVEVGDWEESNQFERVCHYVADVNRKLQENCQHSIRLEDVSANLPALVTALEGLGIVVHPRLASKVHEEVVNATSIHEFPKFEEWQADQKSAYERICGKIAANAGYGEPLSQSRSSLDGRHPPAKNPLTPETAASSAARSVIVPSGRTPRAWRWRLNGFVLESGMWRAPILRPDPEKPDSHRHCIFGGSQWGKGSRMTGWSTSPHTYLVGTLRATVAGDGRAAVFVLSYDRSGNLVHRRQVGVLSESRERIEFACRLRADAARFDVALYAARDTVPTQITVDEIGIRLEPLSVGYAAVV